MIADVSAQAAVEANPYWWVPLASALLAGGGVFGAVALLLKVRPEAGQIVVQAAEGIVVMQANVINDLEKRLERAEARNAEFQKNYDECQRRTDACHEENEVLKEMVENFGKRLKDAERKRGTGKRDVE